MTSASWQAGSIDGAPSEGYVARAVAEECAKVANAPAHQANATLHHAAVALGTIAGAGWLAREAAEVELLAAAAQRGKPEREARATIKSGLDWGAAHPRAPADMSPPANRRPAAVRTGANRSRALTIWSAAHQTVGTIADRYLESRGLPPGAAFDLRYADAVPMPNAGAHPCLLAAVIEPVGGRLLAIQRTALRPDGMGKAEIPEAKASLGGTAGGAVVLGDLGGDGPIVEGEGIETVLSVVEATGHAGIATLSVGTIGKPVLPPGRPVIILVDRGNEQQAEQGAARRHAESRLVQMASVPPEIEPGRNGFDFNDLLQGWGVEAVRPAIDAAKVFDPAASAAASASVSDLEPLPLFRPLGEPEPFPEAALGESLWQAAAGLYDVAMAPVALCAASLLGATALAAQMHADVVLPIGSGQARPLSLFIISVARSGERKSTVDREVLRPVRDREEELRRTFDAEKIEHEAQHEAWERERKRIIGDKDADRSGVAARLTALGAAPPAPLSPFVICEEPTVEGLVKLLAAGQPAMGVFSAEGGQFVAGHGMRDEARLHTAATLCELWDGTPLKRVRAGEPPQMLAGRRVSLHLMMQPGVSTRILGDAGLQDQGLLARILPCAPASTIGTRLIRPPSPASLRSIDVFGARLAALMRRPLPLVHGRRNELSPRQLQLDPIALGLWIEFANAIERQQSPGGDFAGLTSFASKLAEQAARIAGVLTIFDTPEAAAIDGEHMASGIEIAQWFGGEALRLVGAGSADPDLADAQSLLDWLHTVWREPTVSVPDIANGGPSRIRSTDRARKLVAILARHGWLVPLPNGGKIKDRHRREAHRIARREP